MQSFQRIYFIKLCLSCFSFGKINARILLGCERYNYEVKQLNKCIDQIQWFQESLRLKASIDIFQTV